jgi:hypothetical protein
MAEMELRDLRERKSLGIGQSVDLGAQLKESEREQARVYDQQVHSEEWWHAIKANPKALLWCEYRSERIATIDGVLMGWF